MWLFLKLFALCGWAYAIAGNTVVELPGARAVALLFLIVHPLEVPYALHLAGRVGYPKVKAAAATMLFGFLFWLPTLILKES